MIGIKEVIRVLGFIQEYFDNHANEQEPIERKELFGDWSDTVLEAITLLKAQEPRVMTLEEYDAWTDIPFVERDPVFHEERTERGPVTCWVNTTVCSLREYGKNDRCWTSRPTAAEMEATPWPLAESVEK